MTYCPSCLGSFLTTVELGFAPPAIQKKQTKNQLPRKVKYAHENHHQVNLLSGIGKGNHASPHLARSIPIQQFVR